MKEGGAIILAVVLSCPVFHCESEGTVFMFPKEDTTVNQWLSYMYNTVEQFNTNIGVCAAQFTVS